MREPFGDELAIRPLLERLWSYRQLLGPGILLTGVAFVLVLTAMMLVTPRVRVGSLGFRLLFDGAAAGRYPDGSGFNISEIVSTPVLTHVYEANDLARFTTYENFSGSILVLPSSPELDLLQYEFQAKLADTRLAPADRARLEEEFARRRQALQAPSFTLSIQRRERFTRLPAALMEEVLSDALDTWAAHAAESKGAIPFTAGVLSRNILQAGTLETDDYLVAADGLRVKARRFLDLIDDLQRIPGASIVRTGPQQISLPEIRANLEDAVRFRLDPLLNVIRAEGISKNVPVLRLYARSQAFQLQQDRDATAARIESLRAALRHYTMQRVESGGRRDSQEDSLPGGDQAPPAMAPQFGESFLDRLIELSTQTQTSDVLYRQRLTDDIIQEGRNLARIEQELAYYRELVSELTGWQGGGNATEQTRALVSSRTREVFERLEAAVESIGELYASLRAHNLNASTLLYTITTPFSLRAQPVVTPRTAGLYFVLTLLAASVVLLAGCLVHAAVRSQSEEAPLEEVRL